MLTLAALALLSGCGGKRGWPEARCREQAGKLALRADSMVRHYAGNVYPADMSYLGFRDGLALFEQGRCPPGALGSSLREELSPADRAVFLGLLPAKIARVVREALYVRGST
jgi:hypothetical protein